MKVYFNKSAAGSLEILWDYYTHEGKRPPDYPIYLAEIKTGNIYAIKLVPEIGNIIIYPIKKVYEEDLENQESVSPTSEGKPDWSSIESKYFPSGFFELDPVEKQADNNFWRKALLKLINSIKYL